MRNYSHLGFFWPVLALVACPSDPPITDMSPGTSTSTAPESSSTDTPTVATQAMTTGEPTGTSTGAATTVETTGGPETGETGETGESTGVVPAIVVDGLSAPESILHDKVSDVYLISNINGDPTAEDDDGFISRVEPDGTVSELEWISGTADDVTLNAPKGMGIVQDFLYVADINVVHKFDRVSGVLVTTIPIDGALFLNDVATSELGKVYVSDSMTDTIHEIGPDDLSSVLVTSPDLGFANGVLVAGDQLLVVGFMGTVMNQILLEAPQPIPVFTFDYGQLDGLVAVPNGYMVSSWEAQAVVIVDEAFAGATPVVEGLGSPADIEVDLSRNTLLVPLLQEDRAEFYPLL